MSDDDMTVFERGHRPLPEPLKDWLEANGLDLNETPAWPQIEFDEERGVMRIEQFVKRGEPGEEQPVLIRWPGGNFAESGMLLREMPLLVPMDAELRQMWERAHTQAHADMVLRQFAYACGGRGLTLITPRPGQQIVFVMEHGAAGNFTEADMARVRTIFPAHQVDVIAGVSAVLLQDRPKPGNDGVPDFTAPVTPPMAAS
jgi:hypothetical protein